MAVTSIQWDSNSTLMTHDTVMGSRMESGAHPADEALMTEITTGLFFLQLLSKMHGCSKRSGRFGFGRTSFRENRKTTIKHVPVKAYLPPAAQL